MNFEALFNFPLTLKNFFFRSFTSWMLFDTRSKITKKPKNLSRDMKIMPKKLSNPQINTAFSYIPDR